MDSVAYGAESKETSLRTWRERYGAGKMKLLDEQGKF